MVQIWTSGGLLTACSSINGLGSTSGTFSAGPESTPGTSSPGAAAPGCPETLEPLEPPLLEPLAPQPQYLPATPSNSSKHSSSFTSSSVSSNLSSSLEQALEQLRCQCLLLPASLYIHLSFPLFPIRLLRGLRGCIRFILNFLMLEP